MPAVRILLSLKKGKIALQSGLDRFKTHENDPLARDDSSQARENTCVECTDALVPKDLLKTVHRARILRCFSSLHPSLHHIKRIVSQRRKASCRHATQQASDGAQRFCAVLRNHFFIFIEPHESQALVTPLLQGCGKGPLINPSNTFSFQDVLKAGKEGHVQFNAFCFYRLHRRHNNQCLRDTSPQTSDKVFGCSQVTILISKLVFDHRVESKSNPSFGDTSQKSGRQASVEGKETCCLHVVAKPSDHSSVGKLGSFGFGLKLQLCLDEFHRPHCSCFDATSNTSSAHS
mmetsp:Transcript_3/g.19  ORF Transcript_3/g.19 Transcript_3/m.19 type:complete len:289 (-) Transcript_3:68-934(-)